MKKDIRDSSLYREIEALYRSLRRPGAGQISDAAEVHVSPDGGQVVFAGAIVDVLEGGVPTRICATKLDSGDTRVLTFGPNSDRLPKYSPDGRWIAFLSDRHKVGDFQMYLLDPVSGAARSAPRVDGWIEYLHWSPDGGRVLLGVAGHGADISGAQGAVTSRKVGEQLSSWMPAIETGNESHRWRRVWVYDLSQDRVRQVCGDTTNVWEAVWCGNDSIAAVASPGPGEGLWYSARLCLIDMSDGNVVEIYKPVAQLGWPAASASGTRLAVVEATCSDRWLVAGDLHLIDTASSKICTINTRGVDITCTEWRSEHELLLAGHRGFETVVAYCDASSGLFTEVWTSTDISTGGRYVSVYGLGETGDCALVGEGFSNAPQLAVIRKGAYLPVRSFDLGYQEEAKAIAATECMSWSSTDGLEIQGYLLRPWGKGPHPLVMYIHGGPIWHWHPVWLGRWSVPYLTLIKHGYAVFMPNPRGSSGRGQDFARHVYGDIGGGDARDLLSGLTELVERGLADPSRLGVTGGSYGGFMASWLITQDARFAAAVSVAPHTNQVSEHLLSNIPHFMAMLMADKYTNPTGSYFQRSPIMHAHKATTPTLNICGALDRCTPPEEAMQFHSALLESGIPSVLVTYPEEGHGVRQWPAMIDFAARLVGWFEQYMGADKNRQEVKGESP